jgi:hypothetical protein
MPFWLLGVLDKQLDRQLDRQKADKWLGDGG